MQFRKKRKPYEYEGDMVMQAPKNPYSSSSGKSKLKSGSGYQSNPYDTWAAKPEAYEFSSRLQDLEDVKLELQGSGNYNESQFREIQSQINSITKQRDAAFRGWHQGIKSQSPAMAQGQSTSSFYDARTGRPLTPSQIDRFRQQDRAQMLQMGENPYDIHSAQSKFFENKNNTLNRLGPF
jgi:hypothetical protein